MEKEFEALKDLEIIREALLNYRNKVEEVKVGCIVSPQFASIRQSLLELQAIKNAEPSEALKTLEVLDNTISPLLEPILAEYEDDLSDKITANYFALKQALLKAEKLEKAWEVVKKKWVNIAVLIHSTTLEQYNNNRYTPYNLTEEEFELLKEMLANDLF